MIYTVWLLLHTSALSEYEYCPCHFMNYCPFFIIGWYTKIHFMDLLHLLFSSAVLLLIGKLNVYVRWWLKRDMQIILTERGWCMLLSILEIAKLWQAKCYRHNLSAIYLETLPKHIICYSDIYTWSKHNLLYRNNVSPIKFPHACRLGMRN